MSEAIRCGQCRWWRLADDDENEWGRCELNPAIFLPESESVEAGWRQPAMLCSEGCSRGEPKEQQT